MTVSELTEISLSDENDGGGSAVNTPDDDDNAYYESYRLSANDEHDYYSPESVVRFKEEVTVTVVNQGENIRNK